MRCDDATRLLLFGLIALAGCASPGVATSGSAPDGGAGGHRDLGGAPADLAHNADLEKSCGPCSAPAPVCDPSTGQCVPCLAGDDQCPQGSYCAGGDAGAEWSCVPGCKSDGDCAVGSDGGGAMACCDHACVDVGSDATNCGQCGAACAAGQSCCTGQCADTTNDVANCGACGQPCPSAMNATIACASGQCALTGCAPGFADCNMDPKDGCESQPASDPDNCGSCGNFCNVANGTGGCQAGSCIVQSCFAGFADCDHQPGDGCEAAITTDPNNCGGCGRPCLGDENATPGCFSGMCTIAQCNPGFGDCNMNPNDGCEVDLRSDPRNCGMCLNVCVPAANAAVACQAGQCAITGCNGGFLDCDKVPGNGCEADVSKDSANCGACGVRCGAVANGSSSCVNGACAGLSCDANFGDCDKNAANGCETNLLGDQNDCGACGHVCANGQACTAGACVQVGCLDNGNQPPSICGAGNDPETGATWVVCQSSCSSAWLSADAQGGIYHALQICQRLGYGSLGDFGGTCGNVCGYCEGYTSCNSPGSRTFDGQGYDGSDAFGPYFDFVVQWTCLK